MPYKSRRKKRNRFLYLIGILVVGYIVLTYTNNLSADIKVPEKATIERNDIEWWNNDYAYRREITSLSSDNIIIEINHAQLVIDGKSRSDATDLKIVGVSGNTQSEFASTIYQVDTTDTIISIDSPSSKVEKYYVYYGNKSPTSFGNTSNSVFSGTSNSTLGAEESPTVVLKSLKEWILKEGETEELNFLLGSKERRSDTTYFLILNNDQNDKKPVIERNGEIKIVIDNLKTGKHSAYLVASMDGNVFRSNTIYFNYSAPLYVAWTMDWEGTVPDMRYLESIARLSSSYEVPITHYYNPRIYISIPTPESEKRAMSEWIVDRIKDGDDIALHMHMQHDMVEEAGVQAKYNEKSWDSGVSGYDTPSTAYGYDDYLKILRWGKDKVREQIKRYTGYDIPELQGYRAGGWFANSDNLRAMEEAGFIYDSSGRSVMPIGRNMLTQPWLLNNKTQPYYPNINNQNMNTSPNMKLLEIPNNGADSYWSSAQDLITNFYANYSPGSVLDIDNIVVYLSHPNWFYIDEPKLKELFDEIGKYSYEKDNGPVKYITMREYLSNSNYLKAIRSN